MTPWLSRHETQIRIVSGLILFAFAATHFINHAFGLVSIEAMDWLQGLRKRTWRIRAQNNAQLVFGQRPPIIESIQSLLIPCFPRIAGLVPALRPGFMQMPIG